jgi:uncharacterized protein YbaP (TraB family)
MPRTLLCLLLLLAVPALAQTSLWEVSNGKHQVLIGGTVHLLGKDDYPLPQAFEQAYQIADRVYFESDIGAANKPEFSLRVMQTMMYRDGQNLRSELSPEVWQKLQAFTAERNIPPATLMMFKPAFTALTLTVLEAKRLGLGQGVDGYFYRWATRSGKPVAFLETLEQQLGFLDSLNQIDPDALISGTLVELETMPEIFRQAVAAWRKGDMAQIDRLMGAKMREQTPDIYEALLVERNKAWLMKIEAMLQTPELEYVLVGALHLAGPDSLLSMLRQRGYSVSAYSP